MGSPKDGDVSGTSEGPQRGVFLSYRRTDAGPWAGRIAGDLSKCFGRERVFLDVHSNRPGQDFTVQIEEALRASRLVVAVMGPHWLLTADATGARRLHDENDFVRKELEAALRSGIAILIVLVGGAAMPSADDLPPSLRSLAFIQALSISDEDWSYGFGRLLEALERHGLYASRKESDQAQEDWQREVLRPRRYERDVDASRRRALDAVIGAVEGLGYKDRRVTAEAARVRFTAATRDVEVYVVDAEAGHSIVVVEFQSVRTAAIAGVSTVLGMATGGVGFAAWPALRAWERSFAQGFLDNVEGVLEGRGVGDDSVLPFGIKRWLNRNRKV